MSTIKRYIKLANDLDELGLHDEAIKIDEVVEKLAGGRCQCENGGCEKLGTHRAGGCQQLAGEVRAEYLGGLCDECAKLMPKEYLYPPYGTAKKKASLEDEMTKKGTGLFGGNDLQSSLIAAQTNLTHAQDKLSAWELKKTKHLLQDAMTFSLSAAEEIESMLHRAYKNASLELEMERKQLQAVIAQLRTDANDARIAARKLWAMAEHNDNEENWKVAYAAADAEQAAADAWRIAAEKLRLLEGDEGSIKTSSLELEMEKEVSVETDEDDDEDGEGEKETKKKKITLSFD